LSASPPSPTAPAAAISTRKPAHQAGRVFGKDRAPDNT
jgi:hypothetical protein